MASILVVGGAGYVGSAIAAYLVDRGDDVWVLDDLSTGHRSLVLDQVIREGKFIQARVGDRSATDPLFQSQKFDVVMHFAARSLVGESVKFPDLYWENNVEQTKHLLDAMIENGVRRFVFSSTAAVYGDPGNREIDEDLEKKPINPYGETKLAVEKMLADYGDRHGLRSVALRYFNAAGAESKHRVGECHDPETHLIPNLLAAGIAHRPVSVFGDDYPTPDGTCVRDYIHVDDLAQAHAAAADRMIIETSKGGFEVFNLGSAKGYSIREVVSQAETVLGEKLSIRMEARRPGDPAKLVAVADRARKALGFSSRPNALQSILESALIWERKKNAVKRAVFFDRDGTLNFDPGYLNDAEKLELLPGAGESLKRLSDAGYLLIVVSNQSGIARGMITEDQLRRVHHRMDQLLIQHGVRIHYYSLCIHHPDAGCECRKPKAKLITDAATKYHVDLSQSYMVGDKLTDILAGKAAGVRASYLVGTGYGTVEKDRLKATDGTYCADLRSVTDDILGRS